jgi:hypothetical protein
MPKKIGKIWTPINTANPDEVKKHPIKAKLQTLRNDWLIWRNEKISLKSARIETRQRDHGPTGNRVADCLELLSMDLSQGSTRAEAYNAIKSLFQYSANWNDALTKVLPTKADQLQQLRKNVQILFKEYSIIEERAFLEAVYKKSDARLAGPKGYYHRELKETTAAQIPSPIAAAASPVAVPPMFRHLYPR